MTDEPKPFDELMAQMGVRRLDASKKTPSGPRKGKRKKARHPRAQGARTSGSVVLPEAPTVQITPVQPGPGPDQNDAAAEEAPTVQIQPAVTVSAQEGSSEQGDEIRRLRAALRHAQDNLEATREELDRFREQTSELEAHRRSLQRALSRLQEEGEPVALSPRLTAMLEARGLRGRDEFRYLFEAVSKSRQLHGLISWLEPSDEPSVNRFLDDRVVLLGDCENCPVPPGRAVVRVPRDRCEVCEGSDIKRAVRRFEDACLLTGMRRIVFVGGSPKYHRQLGELVCHHRLQLDLIPGDVRRTQRQADHDLAHADVIILWGGTLLNHATSDLYKAKGHARVISVPHRGIARMLQLAGDAIDSAP